MTSTVDRARTTPHPHCHRAAQLVGLATAQPAGEISQTHAAALAIERCCTTPAEARWLQRVYDNAGVHTRRSVLLNQGPHAHDAFYPPPANAHDRGPTVEARMNAFAQHALPLAATAAQQAMANANLEPGDIGQLVLVSCTGFGSPGLDVRLLDALTLPPDVGRSALGFMGCHGAINGLRAAHALATQHPHTHVLLCAVELCSLHFQYGFDRQQIVANALFADGAAACVLRQSTTPPARVTSSTCANRWRLLDTASTLIPDSKDAMTWSIGQHGFRMTLSPQVPTLVKTHLRAWLQRWLVMHDLGVEDIAHWAVHPGGPRVLDAVEIALALSPGQLDLSRDILARSGNMSSPTVLFIIDQLAARPPRGPCVALAFGPGLMIEAALLTPTA